ncbi:uncharacterized protein LOC143368031 [Andrena cerasifolii]|uniref:uncharacterized protein LOC143368031 n=1 Tax=Andrena cerasifolii TaxID=2819439 RepID=UPI004037721A
MKLYLPVVLVALVATLLHSAEYVTAEICPPENCLNPDKCEQVFVDGECSYPCNTCCSVVKEEHRTHCRHWGGECMNACNPILQHPVVDCPDQVCCTLV